MEETVKKQEDRTKHRRIQRGREMENIKENNVAIFALEWTRRYIYINCFLHVQQVLLPSSASDFLHVAQRTTFRRFRKIPKTISFVMSVCPSVSPHGQLGSHWTDLHNI